MVWLFLLSVIIIFSLYYLVRSRLNNKKFFFLSGIRVLLIFCLLWLLSDPLFTFYKTKLKSRKIYFLADNSQSMTIKDEGNRSRIEVVNWFFNDKDSPVKSLSDKNILYRVFQVGDSLQMANQGELPADGPQSNLLSNLKLFFEGLKDTPASIYFMSDGCATEKSKPSQILYPYPVNTVGLGNPADNLDIMIESVEVPATVDLEQDISFKVNIKETKIPENTKLSLKIFDEQNVLVFEKQFLSPVKQKHTLSVKPASAGLHVYTITVEAQGIEEPYTANNKHKIGVLVQKNEINILVAGVPSWDMAFAVRSLRNIKNANLSVYNLIGEKNEFFSIQSNSRHSKDEALKNIIQQDVVIFFDVPLDLFTDSQIEKIQNCVENKGAGLFLFGGEKSFGSGNYQVRPINEMLPVRLVKDDFTPQQFEVRPAKFARAHPLMAGFFEKIDYKMLPPLDGINVINSVKPSADLFLEARSLSSDIKIPLFSITGYGKGKVAVFAGKGLFRWSMQTGSGLENSLNGNILDLFIKKSVSWIASPTEESFLHVIMPKINYPLGEKINIETIVLDRTYLPAEKARVKGKVIGPDKKEIMLGFIPVTGTTSRFSSFFMPAVSGKYTLEIEGVRGDDDKSVSTSYFFVYQSTEEFKRLAADHAYLKKIADLSGGKFVTFEQFNNDIKKLKTQEIKEKIPVTRLVIDYPFILLFILTLCVTEWIFRIKQGLN